MNCIKQANSLGFLNNRKKINCFSLGGGGAEAGATYAIMKFHIALQPDWARLWIMLENKFVLTHHVQVSNYSIHTIIQKIL